MRIVLVQLMLFAVYCNAFIAT